MKPEKFDGKGSYETFLCQFENCVKYNRWDAEQKVAYLRWSLSGAAAQLLWNTEYLSYSQLIEKLRDRFGGRGMEERFQNELRCRRRSKGESIRELAQDIRRLMTLAYPGEQSALSEHIARDAFLSALDEPDFELKIREKEPGDLDTAVKLAQRFEVFRSAVDASSAVRHRFNRHVTGEDMHISLRVEKLEQQMKGSEYQARPSANGTTILPTKEVSLGGKSKKSRAVSGDDVI
jgi:hypothetical protein